MGTDGIQERLPGGRLGGQLAHVIHGSLQQRRLHVRLQKLLQSLHACIDRDGLLYFGHPPWPLRCLSSICVWGLTSGSVEGLRTGRPALDHGACKDGSIDTRPQVSLGPLHQADGRHNLVHKGISVSILPKSPHNMNCSLSRFRCCTVRVEVDLLQTP